MTAHEAVLLAVRWRREPPAHLLDSRERQLLDGVPGWQRRQWIASRLTARAAIAVLTGSLSGCAVLRGPDRLPAVPGWRLSLSHSGLWAACAAAPDGSLAGVDVQIPVPDMARIVRRVCGPAERALSSPLRHWCLKEAAFKACRGGAALGRFVVQEGRPALVRAQAHDVTLRGWTRWVDLPGPDGQVMVAVALSLDQRPRMVIADDAAVLRLLAIVGRRPAASAVG